MKKTISIVIGHLWTLMAISQMSISNTKWMAHTEIPQSIDIIFEFRKDSFLVTDQTGTLLQVFSFSQQRDSLLLHDIRTSAGVNQCRAGGWYRLQWMDEDEKFLLYLLNDSCPGRSRVLSQIKILRKLLSSSETGGHVNFLIQDSVLIRTRDGAVISAKIISKKNNTLPLPVIFTFTIYPRQFDHQESQYWAANGYVAVKAYTRGKYLSPQEAEPFEHDANDAYDVIDWISKQPWCNGKIGMFGGSYVGFTQWAALKKIHPALKTIVPMVAVGPGVDVIYRNGVFSSISFKWLHMASNAQRNTALKFGNQEKWDSVYSVWYKSGRSYRSLDTIAGAPNKIFQHWLQHPSYDLFYRRMIPYKEEFGKINIPILTITGYFDGDQLGALHYFSEHYRYNKNPEHYLLIGPYDHDGAQRKQVSPVQGYSLDPAAFISLDELTLEWFNYILKNSSKPALLKDKINFQVIGTNQWRHVSSMNGMNNDTLTFYLSNTSKEKHLTLSAKSGKKNNYSNYVVDLKERKPEDNKRDVMLLNNSLNDKGYLTFVSDPLTESMSVNGRIFSDLRCIINKKDLDIELEVYELMPDGKYFLLSWYVGRASYAKDREKRQLLTPGKGEIIPIRQAEFTSKQLAKGSRLVVLLGILKNREYQVNYGTGKDVSDETIADGKIPLEVKWLSDSWIKIPVYR